MTHPDDNSPDEFGPSRAEARRRRLDEEAAWRMIVENYGDRPELGEPPSGTDPDRADGRGAETGAGPAAYDGTQRRRTDPAPDAEPPPADHESSPPTPPTPPGPRRFDALDQSHPAVPEPRPAWDDEGHFVPPEPPPLPVPTPARRVAWAGLFGAPLVMLAAIALGWAYPTWVTALLVAAFVGGFVYLVATMQRTHHDDWSGDDGAVV